MADNRGSAVLAAGLMLGGSPLLWAQTKQPADNQRPCNVLFIMVDDMRPTLGCYGDPHAVTPNMDALAKRSRLFNAAYIQQAVCGPSRVSTLTGLLPDRTHVWHNRNLFREVRPDAVTLPALFMNHGYTTLSIGKVFSGSGVEEESDPQSWSSPPQTHWPDEGLYALPQNQGLANFKDTFPAERADVADNVYKDGQAAQKAIAALKEFAASGQPFFFALGFGSPHAPFCAPSRYWDMYNADDLMPIQEPERTPGVPEIAWSDYRELGGYKGIPKDEHVTLEQARELRQGYYACVSYADAQVGKVLEALQQLGLADNTIIVLWGDHGYHLGEQDHWCKHTNFELDTRIPMMIYVPGMAQPGVATDALVESVDIYPTLAELAGLPAPADLDGMSLTPLLEDPSREFRDVALSQFSRPWKKLAPKAMGYTIRMPRYRYTRWVTWPDRHALAEELYDYDQSSGPLTIERKNLVDDAAYAPLLDQMRARMDRVFQERLGPAESSVPAAVAP